MNRQIKFRAWDGYEMTYSDQYTKDKEHPNVNLAEFLNDCYGCDLMQWTGYADMNGKEIYEGDIITAPNGQIEKAVIYFSQATFWYKEWNGMFDEWHVSEMGWCEQYGSKKHGILHWSANRIALQVIGNVFEHINDFLKQPTKEAEGSVGKKNNTLFDEVPLKNVS